MQKTVCQNKNGIEMDLGRVPLVAGARGSREVGGCEQEALRLGSRADRSGRRKRPALVRGSASPASRRESHLYVEYLANNVLHS